MNRYRVVLTCVSWDRVSDLLGDKAAFVERSGRAFVTHYYAHRISVDCTSGVLCGWVGDHLLWALAPGTWAAVEAVSDDSE